MICSVKMSNFCKSEFSKTKHVQKTPIQIAKKGQCTGAVRISTVYSFIVNPSQWILATWPNIILRYQSYACERHVKQKQEHQGNLQKSRTCQETRIHGTCVGSRMGDFYAFGNGNKWRNGGGVQSFFKPTSKQAGSQTETYNTVITWIRTKLSYEIL